MAVYKNCVKSILSKLERGIYILPHLLPLSVSGIFFSFFIEKLQIYLCRLLFYNDIFLKLAILLIFSCIFIKIIVNLPSYRNGVIYMKTQTVSQKDIKLQWTLIDAADKVLGRLAARTAHLLRGKHKPDFSPNMDQGDYVIIINAAKVKMTGKKKINKKYYKHTGYVGHVKEYSFNEMLDQKPEFIIKNAVKGMLPKGRLGRAQLKKLKVYADDQHKHEAQKPQTITI